jgi:RimJ/RimL family protein N-acetyltransferase
MATPPPELEAGPVVLRRYTGDELTALCEAVESSLDHLRPWMPWASIEPLEEGLAEFIRRSVQEFDGGENFSYAIWDAHRPQLVGGTGLHPRLGPGVLEIGYWVRLSWTRRGVASAAASALTDAAFSLAGIEAVHIHCDEANAASASVPRRLGYSLRRIVEDEPAAPADTGRSMEWVVTRADWAGGPDG